MPKLGRCAPVYVAKPPMSAKGTSMPQGHSGVLRHLACGFACASILLVAACDPASTPPKPASPTTYPDLASVPPRPVLADTLEQRREIQHELAAARNNAERRAAEVAYATGRAAEPPPPLPAPSAAPPAGAAPPQPPGGDGAVARAYLDSALNDIRDRGKLRQFMRRMGREAPDPAGPQTLAQAVGLADPPPSAKPRRPGQPEPAPPESFGDYLWGMFGLGEDRSD